MGYNYQPPSTGQTSPDFWLPSTTIIGGAIFFGHKRDDVLYLKVKIDGTDTKRIVKGHYNQYVGTVPSTFQLRYIFPY